MAGPKRTRLWLFRLTAIVVAPVLCLVLIETVLRIAGIGYTTSFFIEEPTAIRTNLDFSRVYFPPAVARIPVSGRFPAPKPPDLYRICVLGGSAAQGFPTASYGFGRVLEAMMRERFPGARVEVVNAAVTAINSHVVLPIARDCVANDADLLVVYAGNNEIVGPYGPGTVFAGFAPSLSTIRASLAVRRSRLGQLLGGLLRRGEPTSANWAGMEMFMGNLVAVDDPRLEQVYDHFGRNLSDIVAAARRKGIPVVISDVAVNLADCPPFASRNRADLGGQELDRWQEQFEEGKALEAAHRHAEAAARYRAAAQIDAGHAELRYRLARCLRVLGDGAAAAEEYSQALELDLLRFRADRGINRAVRAVTEQANSEQVRFVSATQAFANSEWAPGGIPGEELFHDHVHMTFEGNYLLARAMLQGIVPLLPDRIVDAAAGPGLPGPERCAERLAFTDWDRAMNLRRLGRLTERPPFSTQFDHAERRRKRELELQSLVRSITPARMQSFARVYEQAIESTPEDVWLRIGFAELLSGSGDPAGAEETLRDALDADPTHRDLLWEMSKVLAAQNKLDEEEPLLRLALEVDPYFAQAAGRRAVNLLQRGKTDEAIAVCRELLETWPGNAYVHHALGRALVQQGDQEQALLEYREALRLQPRFPTARSDLLNLLVSRGDRAGAIAECRKMVQASPDEAELHLLLAGLLESTGNLEEAATSYESAVQADPESIESRRRYGLLLEKRGTLADATAYHRQMLDQNPQLPGTHYLLALALAREGRTAQAQDQLRDELARDPEMQPALAALARMLASDRESSMQDRQEAFQLARRLAILAPQDPESFDVLAVTYAAGGWWDQAVQAQQRAIQLATDRGGRAAARVEQYAARLERYRAGAAENR